MVYDGKTYRNLQDQVGYLTGKYDDLQDQINDVRGKLTHYVVVDTLPTGDDIDPSAVYLLGPMGTAPDTYYEEWVYVQKADETWIWEKLGDTDSVDLSGYLEKQTGATTNKQAYIKNTDGTQDMIDINPAGVDAANGKLAMYYTSGRLRVGEPNNGSDAASKQYVDNGFVAKQTGASSLPRAYVKNTDGTQASRDITTSATPSTLVYRDSYGRTRVASPSDGEDAANKTYVDNKFLAKQTGATTYAKLYAKDTDGTQTTFDMSTSHTVAGAVVRRYGEQVRVPTTPVNDNDATSKKYVDDAVGQLLYLHDLEIIVTVDATNYLYVKAYLVNGSATAITSFDRILYKRIDVQWGAYGPDIVNCEPCAVTKLPDTFRQDKFDDPFAGFLYQYISAGNLISGKTDSSMSTTITDTVISF